jgi:2-oxoglutarate dehydrogenase complex dehydrogenase (E1) component-like enzyme
MLQGMAGVKLFDTFEEDHTTPTIPRYNTRALARQHAAHHAHTLRPRIFRPLAFPTRQKIPKHMANSFINEETGASFEYHLLINDASTFTIWNEAAANEFGRLAQCVGNRIDKRKKCYLRTVRRRHPSQQI